MTLHSSFLLNSDDNHGKNGTTKITDVVSSLLWNFQILFSWGLCKKGLIDCNRSDNRFVALTKRETRVGISSLSRFADHAILISCFALIGKNLLFFISSDVMEFQGHFLRFLRKSKNDVISRKVRCLSLQLHFYLRCTVVENHQKCRI